MIGILILGLVLTCAESFQHHQLPKSRPSPFGYQVAVNFGSHGNRRQGAHIVSDPWQQPAKPKQTWQAQPKQTWQPQPTWQAQPTWQVQQQPQSSKTLHSLRHGDPNWAVNNPLQPWEQTRPEPQTYSKPQTWSQPKKQVNQPQTWSQPQTYNTWTQPQPKKQVYPQRPGNVLWAVPKLNQQRLADPLWAVKAKKPSEDPLWALNAHQRAAFLHG